MSRTSRPSRDLASIGGLPSAANAGGAVLPGQIEKIALDLSEEAGRDEAVRENSQLAR